MLNFIQLNYGQITGLVVLTIIIWTVYFALKKHIIDEFPEMKKYFLIGNVVIAIGYGYYFFHATVHNQVDKTAIDRSFVDQSTNHFNNAISK